jgi:hypothetical protein
VPYVSDMSLSMSVHSLVLSPDEITKLAGASPTDFHFLGDPRGVTLKGTHVSNYWSLQIKVSGENETADRTDWFSDGLVRLLDQVSINFVNKLEALDPDSSAIVWVGLFDIQDQGAFNIRADVSRRLGEYGLELVFDMYVDHEPDDTVNS